MKNDLSLQFDICVLIPCYNNLAGLLTSIDSIAYDHSRLLVVVIDDGSSSAITRDLLFQHLPISINLELIRLEKNQGITKALNNGLELIYRNYNVRFVARLDCGDICSPDRMYRQVAFLDQNPGIDLLGTWCYFKDKGTGLAYEYITPTTHEFIARSMYFRNVFVHPTVMWRAATLTKYRYPENYPHAEDYGLFYDIISTKKTAIIDAFLVTCEINIKGISVSNRSAQLKSRLRVICDHGKNKWLVAAGSIKLFILMTLPYRLISRMKGLLYKPKPEIMKNTKIEIL